MAAFLSHLATDLKVAASTQNQALNALVFLYGSVLHQPLGDIGGLARVQRVLSMHREALASAFLLNSSVQRNAERVTAEDLQRVAAATIRDEQLSATIVGPDEAPMDAGRLQL